MFCVFGLGRNIYVKSNRVTVRPPDDKISQLSEVYNKKDRQEKKSVNKKTPLKN